MKDLEEISFRMVEDIIDEIEEKNRLRCEEGKRYDKKVIEFLNSLKKKYVIFDIENIDLNAETFLNIATEKQGIHHSSLWKVEDLWRNIYCGYLEDISKYIKKTESKGGNWTYIIPILGHEKVRRNLMDKKYSMNVIEGMKAKRYL